MPSEQSGSPAARCLICAAEFTAAEIETADACPRCGDTGVPMDPEQDVTVDVNWHELRILGIWAENWAAQHKDKDDGKCQRTVAAIAGRLRAQYPERGPLTMSGEIAELRQAFHSQVEVEGFDEDEEANDAAA